MIIRVDLDTLMRGVPLDGELCQIDGFGPIPVSVVEDLIRRGSFVATVLMSHQKVIGVHHQRRRPNAYQQTALDFLYPTCAAAGCTARTCQADHRIDWAKTHHTVLDELDLLCRHHHDLKTRNNWSLVDGLGKRPFVSPDDPRHPRHRRPPTSGGPPSPGGPGP